MNKIKNTLKNVNPKVTEIITNVYNVTKNYVSTNILFLSFVILALFDAALLRQFTVGGFWNIDPSLADLVVIVMFGSICYFIKPKHQYKMFIGILSLFSLICMINSIYYTIYFRFLQDAAPGFIQYFAQFRG